MPSLFFFFFFPFQWVKAIYEVMHNVSGCYCSSEIYVKNHSSYVVLKAEKLEIQVGLNFPLYQCVQDEWK